ncbi:MAG: transcriptional regulator, partial [Mycobacteriales bacterium]
VTLLVVVGCAGLGYWQLKRGEDGNLRSYAYALEWPFFAAAAIYMWWKTLRDDLRGEKAAGDQGPDPAAELPISRAATAIEAEADPELDAYNAYLAELDEAASAQLR